MTALVRVYRSPTKCGAGEHGATCDDGEGEYAEEDRECLRALLRDITAVQHSRCRRVATSAVPPWGFASEFVRARERDCVCVCARAMSRPYACVCTSR